MNTNEMRKQLANRYSPSFRKRINDMPDDQVYAIWVRVFGNNDKQTKKGSEADNDPSYLQATLF